MALTLKIPYKWVVSIVSKASAHIPQFFQRKSKFRLLAVVPSHGLHIDLLFVTLVHLNIARCTSSNNQSINHPNLVFWRNFLFMIYFAFYQWFILKFIQLCQSIILFLIYNGRINKNNKSVFLYFCMYLIKIHSHRAAKIFTLCSLHLKYNIITTVLVTL